MLAKPAASSRGRWLIVAYFGTSFLLHLVWEMLQMPLFALPPASFIENLRMCLFATATGDMAFMLILYLTAAVVHRDAFWILEAAAYRHPATWTVTVLVGALLAVCFELWAVHVVHRWEYGSMPLVPVVGVGWIPLLQMIVVPLLVLSACSMLANRNSRAAGPRHWSRAESAGNTENESKGHIRTSKVELPQNGQ